MFSRRLALQAGFGVVISLLVLSTAVAYQIQEAFSKRTADIYHRFVKEQEILNNLRRVLWGGGLVARDFFLNRDADRAVVYRRDLQALRDQGDSLFRDLSELRRRDALTEELERKARDLWATLDSIANSTVVDAQRYSFVQTEVVPRREAAAAILRQLEAANKTWLYESESEFSDSRSVAASGLVLMLVLCVLTGIGVAVLSLRYSWKLEKQALQQFEEVSAAKLELERLSARLMEIQEEERMRLSRELHDEIGQSLALLKIELNDLLAKGALAAEMKSNVNRARDLAERTLHTVRNIMTLLRPSMLDDLGLAPALQWLAEDFRTRTRIPCALTDDGLADDLPEQVKTCIYRVTQEALHNCEKHARATSAEVSAKQLEDEIVVEIRDDGVGFVQAALNGVGRRRLGLLGMRERAGSLGGTLRIDSEPGKGTRVVLTLPVKAPVGSLARDYQTLEMET